VIVISYLNSQNICHVQTESVHVSGVSLQTAIIPYSMLRKICVSRLTAQGEIGRNDPDGQEVSNQCYQFLIGDGCLAVLCLYNGMALAVTQ
jgi:hypothetical protein